MTLTEFILARIAEDEAAAEECAKWDQDLNPWAAAALVVAAARAAAAVTTSSAKSSDLATRVPQDESQRAAGRLARIVEFSETGCWLWMRGVDKDGYGKIRVAGRYVGAHRAAYEALVEPIPGLVIDHLCRNRRCLNPDHLEPVTNGENVKRGLSPSALNALKTHCVRGHPFNEENTYVWSRGRRSCRVCARERARIKEAS